MSSGIIKRGPIEIVDHAMEFWLKQMNEELTAKRAEIDARNHVAMLETSFMGHRASHTC